MGSGKFGFFRAYRRGKASKKILRKFILIVGSVTGIYIIVASIITVSLLAGGGQTVPAPPSPIAVPSEAAINGNGIDILPPPVVEFEEDDSGLFTPPARTNILVVGIDQIGLSDVVLVVSFVRDSGDVHILNIPRDTFTLIPDERIAHMRELGLRPSNPLKINAMIPFGREYGVYFLQQQLAETLGIQFHYYVKFSTTAFREVVDLIGGVEIEVPRRMYYRDPYQHPPLVIDIPAGLQLLNGRMAEGFVRYRATYADGDMGRINAQQQFMTQLFRQALRRDSIMQDPVGLARIAIRHVETDIGADLLRYIPYIPLLSPDRIFTHTLPGNPNARLHGASFFLPYSDQVPELINTIFFSPVEPLELDEIFSPEPETETVIYEVANVNSSRNARISVQNSTRVGGLGMNIADRLHMGGYPHIVQVGLYSDSQPYETIINVREEGQGHDLLEFFESAVIQVDTEIPPDIDILIIVGLSEV
jgi:LCP family protein required for cell wall assembly